jgi:hypothetical protein
MKRRTFSTIQHALRVDAAFSLHATVREKCKTKMTWKSSTALLVTTYQICMLCGQAEQTQTGDTVEHAGHFEPLLDHITARFVQDASMHTCNNALQPRCRVLEEVGRPGANKRRNDKARVLEEHA